METPTLPFQLRPYQVEAANALLEKRLGIIVAPTGSGKTAVALECIRRLDLRTAILVPTINLMFNVWNRDLVRCGVKPSLFYGQEKQLGPITIFVYNSAFNHLELLDEPGRFTFIVIDEVHHMGSRMWSIFLDIAAGKPYALGLTSHIQRLDGEHKKILQVMPVVYNMDIPSARENGFISDLDVAERPSEMDTIERISYNRFTDIISRSFYKLGTTDITLIARMARGGNTTATACLSAIAKRKVLLSKIRSKPAKLIEIIKENPDEKILVFSESIQGIENIKKILMSKGIACGVYHSKVPLHRRKITLSYWGKAFQVLLSVRCLEEGSDIPSVKIGVIVASGSGTRQWIQRIGRMMRPYKDEAGVIKSGTVYIVYCPGTLESRFAGKVRRILHK